MRFQLQLASSFGTPSELRAASTEVLSNPRLAPYIAAHGITEVAEIPGGLLVGPDLAVSFGARLELGEGWITFSGEGLHIAGQRDSTVIPIASVDGVNLDLLATPPGPFSLALHGGGTVVMDDGWLRIRNYGREAVIWAFEYPVCRVAGEADVDLRSVIELRSGSRPSADSMAKAVRADETTGLRHRYAIEPNPPSAGEPVKVWLDTDQPIESARVYWTSDGSYPAPDSSEVSEFSPDGKRLSAILPGQPDATIVRYRIQVRTPTATTWVSDAAPEFVSPTLARAFLRPVRDEFSYEVRTPTVPDWVTDGVMYHVILDRYARDDGSQTKPLDEIGFLGFGGGTLKGLTKRLDYIASLGVNSIWVSPITVGNMHVPYDFTDMFDVDPRLGTLDDARELCARAHALGMKVVLDIELSYFGGQHEAVRTSRPGWMYETDDGRHVGWFGNTVLVAADHFTIEVRDYFLRAAVFWSQIGFDGFRIDSAHAVSFDFLTHWGAVSRAANSEVFNLVEAAKTLDFCSLYRGRCEGFLDFGTAWAIRMFAANGSTKPIQMHATALANTNVDGLAAATFFENHDMDRLSFICGGDVQRVKLAYTLLLTMPGLPILYYGTEAGLFQTQAGDISTVVRPPMVWDEQVWDAVLLDRVRTLVRLRRESDALRRGSLKLVSADDDQLLYCFVRETAEDSVLVIANGSTKARSVSVAFDTPDGEVGEATGAKAAIVRNSQLTCDLLPLQALIYRAKPSGGQSR